MSESLATDMIYVKSELANDKFSTASLWVVKDADREKKRKVQEYVRELMRKEAQSRGHGGQAHLAVRLGFKPPHISNMLAEHPTRNPGPDVQRAFAQYLGVSMSDVERAALHGVALMRSETQTQLDIAIASAKSARIADDAIASVLQQFPKDANLERDMWWWFDMFRAEHFAIQRVMTAQSPLGKGPAKKRPAPKEEAAPKPVRGHRQKTG